MFVIGYLFSDTEIESMDRYSKNLAGSVLEEPKTSEGATTIKVI